MFALFSIFCLVSTLSARNPKLKEKLLRVQNGYDLEAGKYPFVVMLMTIFYGSSVSRMCTGSMITEDWGLTAAHCKKLDDKMYAWYGNFTVPPTLTKLYAEVLEMIPHPSYRWLSTDGGREDLFVNNDICLFRVGSKINIQSYGRLSAVDRGTMIGLSVTYVGGGSTLLKPLGGDLFRLLQVGDAAIIPCDMEMSSKSKYIICIAPKCTKRLQRPWYGDSGGPLIYDGNIIGVCSYGIESKIITRAGYAPVSPYTDWIYDVMHSTK